MKLPTQPPNPYPTISKPIFFLSILLLLFFSIFLLKQFQQKEEQKDSSTFITETMSSQKPLRLLKEQDGFVIDIQKSSISYCYPNQQCKKKVYPRPYLNTLLSQKHIKSRPEINDLLRMYGIPVPRYIIINRMNAGKTYPQQYPVVLKPLSHLQKYHSIYTHIDNYAEYTQTRDDLLKNYERIMVENQIEGESYRIYLFAGDVMDIIQRIRPSVTGDGKHTVRQLIEMRNKMRIQEKKHPTRIISEKLIDEQGYSINSVLTRGVSVYITHSIHYQNGSDTKHLSIQQIPKENISLFKKAVQIIGFECAGIDFVSPDITQSYQTPPTDQVFIQDSVYQADRSFGTIISIHDMIQKHIITKEKEKIPKPSMA